MADEAATSEQLLTLLRKYATLAGGQPDLLARRKLVDGFLSACAEKAGLEGHLSRMSGIPLVHALKRFASHALEASKSRRKDIINALEIELLQAQVKGPGGGLVVEPCYGFLCEAGHFAERQGAEVAELQKLADRLCVTALETRLGDRFEEVILQIRHACTTLAYDGLEEDQKATIVQLQRSLVELHTWTRKAEAMASSHTLSVPSRREDESRDPTSIRMSHRRRPKVPRGWIRLQDASQQYGIADSTLQHWRNTVLKASACADEETHEILFQRVALRKLLRQKGLLHKGLRKRRR